MINPVVERLYYSLQTAPELTFENPPPIEEELESFKLRLENNSLVIKMKEVLSTESEARSVVEPFLKAWELDTFLNGGQKTFWFKFLKSEIVDKSPVTDNNSRTLYAKAGAFAISFGYATLHLTRKNYPSPPHSLKYTPDVESLVKRYEGYLNGREPLLSMAYFCLSLIESTAAGSRAKAAKKYGVEFKVLHTLGELTSIHGDKTEARKVDGTSSFTPLTEVQKNWIVETIRLLIRRKAEYDCNPNNKFSLITISSLPNL